MFRSFGLKENPFHVSPDPRFLFNGPAYETAVAELMFGIQAHRGLLVLTGEAGTGKTTLMRHFLQWLNVRHFSSAYIFHAHLDPRDLYEFILRDFGVPLESTRKSDLLVSLHRWLLLRQAEGDSPVVVIDEAQALSLRTLNELNAMLNLENSKGKLLQIVLAGQPELDEKLRRPESRALRQRIMVRCRLPLLTLEETTEYIESRLCGAGNLPSNSTKLFPLQTVETIYSFARGIPRIVNLLCEHGLVGAYADHQTTVSPQNIRRAAAEFDLVGAPFSAGQPHVVLREPLTPAEIPPAVRDKPAPQPQETVAWPAESSMTPETGVPAIVSEAQAPLQQFALSARPDADASLLAAAETAGCLPLVEASAPPPLETIGVPVLRNQPEGSPEISSAAPFEHASQLATPEFVAAVVSWEEASPPVRKTHQAVSAAMIAAQPRKAAVAQPELPAYTPQSSAVAPARRRYAWRKHREVSAFERYWREVAASFIRDWRQFFRSVVPQAATIPALPSFRSDSIPHKALESLRGWLTKPLNFRSSRLKSEQISSDSDKRRD